MVACGRLQAACQRAAFKRALDEGSRPDLPELAHTGERRDKGRDTRHIRHPTATLAERPPCGLLKASRELVETRLLSCHPELAGYLLIAEG